MRTPWQHTPFATQHLPAQVRGLLESASRGFTKGRAAREALEKACQLYDFLPLPADSLASVDLKQELGVAHAVLLVAERVNRVNDHNRHPQERVDFFAYFDNGHVVRFHPGRTPAASAKPHDMPAGSSLYRWSDAARFGVGSALHRHPPTIALLGDAHQLAPPAEGAAQATLPPRTVMATPDHLREVNPYDAQAHGWRTLQRYLDNFAGSDFVDLTAGDLYPWWLPLANTGANRDLVQDGVLHVGVQDGHLVVENTRELVWVNKRKDKLPHRVLHT